MGFTIETGVSAAAVFIQGSDSMKIVQNKDAMYT